MSWKKIWETVEKIAGYPIIRIEGVLEWLYWSEKLAMLTPFAALRRRQFVKEFCRQISILCNNHLSLPHGLGALSENYGLSRRAKIYRDLADSMLTGESLSKACEQYPTYFPAHFRKIIAVGEKNGKLPEAMSVVQNHAELLHARWRRLISVLLYPAFLLCISFLVNAFILIFILPRFTELIEIYGAEPPWITEGVIKASDIFRRFAPFGLLLFVLSLIVLSVLLRFDAIRSAVTRILLAVPVIGAGLRGFHLATFLSVLKIELLVNTPMPEAVKEAASAVDNPLIRKRLMSLIPGLEQGKSLTDLMEQGRLVDSKALWQLRLGEWRESLPDTLEQVSRTEILRPQFTLRLMQVLEPMALLCIGVIHGAVAGALYLPLFYIVHYMDYWEQIH